MIILVTGGASGLGEAITRRLAAEKGNRVYFTYCKSEANAKIIEADLSNTQSIKCDFRNDNDIQALRNRIDSLEIDVLINNAYPGTYIQTHFHKLPEESFVTEFEESVLPTILITKEAINYFRKKKSGKIITILTSFLTHMPPIGSAIYVANKAYLAEMVKVWATENSKFNISSNAVSPSFMLTGAAKNVDERVIEQIIEMHPLKKLLTVAEAAESILYFVNVPREINGVNHILNSGLDVV